MITLSMTPYQIKKEESNRLDYILGRKDVNTYLNACFDDEFGIPGGHTIL